MRILRDLIVVLCCNLRMLGLPLDGTSDVMCDNQGVANNMSLPQSTLGKEHNAVNCHVVRETDASGILWVGNKDTETNFSDLLTKGLGCQRRYNILPF